jgi:hypothetical protein
MVTQGHSLKLGPQLQTPTTKPRPQAAQTFTTASRPQLISVPYKRVTLLFSCFSIVVALALKNQAPIGHRQHSIQVRIFATPVNATVSACLPRPRNNISPFAIFDPLSVPLSIPLS